MKLLTPHTKEWFDAFSKSNPQEAAHAKQIIKSAGTPEVCSDCGGTPASDYRVMNKWFGPDLMATFRLCDDCRSTRATTEGEEYIPFSGGGTV